MDGYERAFLVKCSRCSFVFCRKIPASEELIAHYTNYPGYTQLSPITLKRYRSLLAGFERFRKTGNLIDLGCGNGLFLKCAREAGWKVYGTEFSEECIEFNRMQHITVYRPDQIPPELLRGEFDMVTSFEVIEHLNTPNREAELVRSLLRKDGAFYFTTPNFNSLSRRLLGSRWNVIEYPEHLSYFTPSTAHRLMTGHGFRKRFVTTTAFSVGRFTDSKTEVKNQPALRENDEALRVKLETNAILRLAKNLVNSGLNTFGIGDALKALYIKD
jgi:2-polyprenyl-3-methyl-5-hydroxy-6-metoxy-1,4-benzoquinol methylase